MMQSEILHQSPWSFYEGMDSIFDQVLEPYQLFTMDDHVVGDCVFNSTMLSTPQDTVSEVFSIPSPSTIFTNDLIQYPIDEDTLQLPSLMELDGFEFDANLSSQIANIFGHGYPEESEGTHFPQPQFKTLEESFPLQGSPSEVEDSWSPPMSLRSEISFSSSIQQPSLNLPQEGMEICNQVSLPHLMEAYVETKGKGQNSLAEAILRRMSQKVNPRGDSLERLASYLSQDMTNHGDYLRGEASKNFGDALRVFHQGVPHRKIADFAAISAILEAVPEDCDGIHIIDFYLGHGAQWAPMIETIAKFHKSLKLTSIRLDEESPECVSTPLNFEETRRQLYEHAKSCGLKLKVEEKRLEELVGEIKKMKKKGGRREFLAFNCMVGLLDLSDARLVSPLQSTSTQVWRKREQAMEFLKVAEDLINTSDCKGIITSGDGDAFEKMKNNCDFRSFIEGHLVHYQAWLESIESHFTPRFSEARTAIEVLFVAPCVSSLSLLQLQTWEEKKKDWDLHQEQMMSLEGCRLSNNILLEAREVLNGSEGSYEARIEGQSGNVLVLEWKGTQLLRLSTWKN
ncbi:protein NODULATION SIGNALING PATHWAY 2-like [Lotus japonicus]|uniref:protein NODULATION SIGNALING PATHWAY 2-like n=1 Tax=Lotus japonicus TaxID=34305 RepID=UPI0025887C5D|nr:protein NODULATION SIGNALING PATHWAY 2-like [Lotus japonicus]